MPSRAFFRFYDEEAAKRFAYEAQRWAGEEYIPKKLERTGRKDLKTVAVRVTILAPRP